MENKDAKQALIRDIKEKVEELLALDDVPEVAKEKLIGRALNVIEAGKTGVAK